MLGPAALVSRPSRRKTRVQMSVLGVPSPHRGHAGVVDVLLVTKATTQKGLASRYHQLLDHNSLRWNNAWLIDIKIYYHFRQFILQIEKYNCEFK